MSYTSGATVNQTTAISDITIALSGAPDIPDPIYCQRLNVKAGVNITNLTVSSGGWASSGNYTNVTVQSGGSLTINGGSINGLTAASGAILENLATNNAVITGQFNVASGAKLRAGNVDYDFYTDEAGWIHGLVVTGAAYARTGIKLTDVWTRSYLYLQSSAIVSGISNGPDNNLATGGSLLVSSGTTALDVKFKNATGGFLAICASGATIGGANTTITNTQIRYIAFDKTGNRYNFAFKDDDISIQSGVITGMTLKTLNAASGNIGNTNSASWLHDIHLVSGIVTVNAIVSSGGSL